MVQAVLTDARRTASAPSGLHGLETEKEKIGCKAVLLTTPRRQPPRSQTPGNTKRQRPLGLQSFDAPSGGEARGFFPTPKSTKASKQSTTPASPQTRVAPASLLDTVRPNTAEHGQSWTGQELRPGTAGAWKNNACRPSVFEVPGSLAVDFKDANDDAEENIPGRSELVRLRRRIHKQACELQETKKQLAFTERELREARGVVDELMRKSSNLERIERVTSAELLEERRKSDELSKQVKSMSQNLMNVCNAKASSGGQQDITGLQKRCFKLVQQNTALTMQSRLLGRQKGWAEAKARVLQSEVTSVYLGTHDQVKGTGELEIATEKEFTAGSSRNDDAVICKMLLPCDYKHTEAVIDFLTHVAHTQGKDVHGFLQSSRVFNEEIRTDCLSGLGREFYAHWQLNHQLPHVLRAVERIVDLKDYVTAFKGFSSEIMQLLGCTHAKIWVVDKFWEILWTCYRDVDSQLSQTLTQPLPKGRSAAALKGQGLVAAAYATQKIVNVTDAQSDPRFCEKIDAGQDRFAKSSICVPVFQQGEVRVVVQAVNKLQAPQFDSEADARVLRLLGRVAMQVIRVCETSGTASVNSKRKDSLLQLFNNYIPCVEPVEMLVAMEQCLREMFLAQDAALHVVAGRGQPLERQTTTGWTVDVRARTVSEVPNDGLRGIIGNCVRTLNHFSVSSSQLEGSGSPYDSSVDLPLPDRTVLHTVPIVEGIGVAAVCQFVCPSRDLGMIGDDGSFQPENTLHFRLLRFLLNFLRKHLHVLHLRVKRNSIVGISPRKLIRPQGEATNSDSNSSSEDEMSVGRESEEKASKYSSQDC